MEYRFPRVSARFAAKHTIAVICLAGCLVAPLGAQGPDPGCESYQAWINQSNPRTDPTGLNGHAYPEANATYWVTRLTGSSGSSVTIKGRFPSARYMALQVYDYNRNVLGAINDVDMDPDPGQNNPYRNGTAQGTYTVKLVFGRKPLRPAANTFYTSGELNVILIYRIYYSNNPDDVTGGTFNPVLPVVTTSTGSLTSCPVRPIILPEDLTVWGRLDNIDFVGTVPPDTLPATNPPTWFLSVTNPRTPYYPSADNNYMSAQISRRFLLPPFNNDMVVIRMRAPTFTDTQHGVPPYAAAQMRFWSMCTDEPITTSVVRCTPDYVPVQVGGFVTFVVSDPSKRPSDAVLGQWNANWLPWGALEPGDTVYDIDLNPLTNANGVYYYGLMLYRQTVTDASFTQSILNVGQLPRAQQQAAMGEYWPQIGYCKTAAFQSLGAGCIGH